MTRIFRIQDAPEHPVSSNLKNMIRPVFISCLLAGPFGLAGNSAGDLFRRLRWRKPASTAPSLRPRRRVPSRARRAEYFDMSVHGDVAGLKANAIPAIAGDFGSIEQAVVTNKTFLAGRPAGNYGNVPAGCLSGQGSAAAGRLLLRHLQFARPHRILHSQSAAGTLCHRLSEGRRQGPDHAHADLAGDGGRVEAGRILSAAGARSAATMGSGIWPRRASSRRKGSCTMPGSTI